MNYCIVHHVDGSDETVCRKCAIDAKENSKKAGFKEGLSEAINQARSVKCPKDSNDYRLSVIGHLRNFLSEVGKG